jgi:heavy metal translocating P-type ATPase
MKASPDACYLCGLPLRYGRIPLNSEGGTINFCCQGCRQVYLMLSEVADGGDPADFRHTDLFRRCVEMGVIPGSEEDLAVFAERAGTALREDAMTADGGGCAPQDGSLTLHLVVEGMWCPACAWVIEETLHKQTGVHGVRCNFSTDRLRCVYNPTQTSPDAIGQAIQRLGYAAREPDALATDRDRRRDFVRFAISTFVTMNVMMLSFSLYSGFFTDLDADAIGKISWPIFIMATGVMVYGGMPLFRKGLVGLAHGQPGMEALIGIGSISAYGYSVFNLFRGSIHLYFDTACMLIILVQLGKLLERRAKDRIQADLGHYFSLMPAKVRLCHEGDPKGRYVSAAQLAPGDLFRVADDETLPADGVVVEGKGTVDQSSLTGEARPQPKYPGDRLVSGTRVIEGRFLVRAETVGRASTLGQMLAIMEAALGRKTTTEGRTDRVLRVFVPVMVGLALATIAALWLKGAAFETAFVRGLTVLVISCPCALGLAVPLARVAGVTLAARQGILVQDFAAFDMAERIDTVVFDKTGTLTQGRWQLLSVVPGATFDGDTMLALAAGLETGVDHPIAVEIRRAVREKAIPPLQPDEVAVHGQGVAGRWNGRRVRIGSAGFTGAERMPSGGKGATTDAHDGAVVSWVYLTVGRRLAACLGFGDRLKPNAKESVRRLKKRPLDVRMVSGDGPDTTAQVGAMLGLDKARGGCRPLEKAAFVEELRRSNKTVAMVGDGINDAPALASADLSVAVFAGRQLGEEAQAVTLMGGDPLQLDAFLRFARRVNRKIGQNLWGSVIYNLVSIPIAMAGWLSPLVAVVAMLLSSLSVTTNTLMLIRREKKTVALAEAGRDVESLL